MCLVKSLYGLWRVPLLATVMLYGCSTDLSPERSPKTQKQPIFEQKGKASWYGPGFHGKETASGETYNQNKLTAAHRTLPLGTEVEVTNLKSGKSVKVEINDRGPYVGNRVIDLSRAAAQEIGMKEKGLATVKIEADSVRKKSRRCHGSKCEIQRGREKENCP